MSTFRLLYPGEPPMLEYGQTALDSESGTFIHNLLSGQMSVTAVTIGTVTVADLADVAVYGVRLAGALRTERFKFRLGGHVEIDRDSLGRVVEVRGRQVRLESRGDDLVVHPLPSG